MYFFLPHKCLRSIKINYMTMFNFNVTLKYKNILNNKLKLRRNTMIPLMHKMHSKLY